MEYKKVSEPLHLLLERCCCVLQSAVVDSEIEIEGTVAPSAIAAVGLQQPY